MFQFPVPRYPSRAAFQYGVKMNDGRKTRRFGGLSDKAREKAKLNREWQQISQVRKVYTYLLETIYSGGRAFLHFASYEAVSFLSGTHFPDSPKVYMHQNYSLSLYNN